MSGPDNLVGLIGWIPVSRELPDDDETVLLFAPRADDPVWLGWHGVDEIDDRAKWFYVDATEAPGVEAWAPMPRGPR